MCMRIPKVKNIINQERVAVLHRTQFQFPSTGSFRLSQVIRSIKIKNGNEYYNFNYYKCPNCGSEIPESDPHHEDNNNIWFCNDCAFLTDKITE